MLKFLEGREKEANFKATIRKRPEIVFGVSLQSPSSFQNQYALISPTSYINPYIDIEKNHLQIIAPPKINSLSPNWTHKTNISLVEEGKIIGSGDLSVKPDRYHQNYLEEIRKNSSRFRLTKGQFTHYVERNNLNDSAFGPLYGEERSQQKSLQTKRSIMRKSGLKMEKSRQKLQMQQLLRKKSSKELEKIIDLKRTLRHKRQDFHHHYQSQISERKQRFRQSFILPKVLTHRQKDPKNQTKIVDFGIFRTIDNSALARYIK